MEDDIFALRLVPVVLAHLGRAFSENEVATLIARCGNANPRWIMAELERTGKVEARRGNRGRVTYVALSACDSAPQWR